MKNKYLNMSCSLCVGRQPQYHIYLRPICNDGNKFKIKFSDKKQLDKLFEEFPSHFRLAGCKYDIKSNNQDSNVTYLLLEFIKPYRPRLQECEIVITLKSKEDEKLAQDIYKQLSSQVLARVNALEKENNQVEENNFN